LIFMAVSVARAAERLLGLGAMYARDHALIATPIGAIRIEGDDAALTGIRIGGDGAPSKGSATAVRPRPSSSNNGSPGNAKISIWRWRPAGTPRGEALRAGLIAVGYGETLSYGALARALGSSPRAIGQLCARNPFPIVVPCHRVLGEGGRSAIIRAATGPRPNPGCSSMSGGT
jgi:methylated-DNA-[protein]-cysteine S-methyltransferase